MTSTLIAGRVLGGRIAEALKLDIKFIKRITLDFDVDNIAFCTVEFYPDDLQCDSVTNMLETEIKQYALTELQQSNVSQRTD